MTYPGATNLVLSAVQAEPWARALETGLTRHGSTPTYDAVVADLKPRMAPVKPTRPRGPYRKNRYSDAAKEVRCRAIDAGLFQSIGSNGRVICLECGAAGYAGGSWMDKHIAGHSLCWCGKVNPTSSLRYHQRHRTHPKREES